jgi:acyl-CoA synthetase (AMP-forming)/AMP-acid ligase II/acyl carrier protein
MNNIHNKHNFSNLVELLQTRSFEQPDKNIFTFLEDGETESGNLTFYQLDQKARAIAARLQLILAPGERALLLYPPGLEFIAAFFGCLYAGVIAVPAYPPRKNQNSSRIKAIVSDAEAAVALTTKSQWLNIENQFANDTLLSSLQWLTTDSIELDCTDWRLPIDLHADSLAFIQYTSGSTGVPKGVMVSHGNLLHNSELIYKCFEHSSNSKGVIWLPPYHDMGLIGGVLQPIYGNFPVVLMSPVSFLQKPLRWLQAISRYQATTSGAPDFAYDLVCRKVTPEQLENIDLSSWEVAFTGAEPIRYQTLTNFANTFAEFGFQSKAFYPCYGMAETTLIVSGGLKDEMPVVKFCQSTLLEENRVELVEENQEDTKAIIGVGKTSPDQKVIIVDPESRLQCIDNQVGEIWVSGRSVAGGYWKKPELTQECFNASLANTNEGTFLRTGDLGFLQEGELFITGRIKDVIIIRGRNHYPQDIEITVENSHPALRKGAGAAFSVEVNYQEKLVVVQEVERAYLRKLDTDEVIKAVRGAVSEHHELQVYAVVLIKTASIPKTSSGKIQRHACKNGFLNSSLDAVFTWTLNTQQDLLQLYSDVDSLLEQIQLSATRTLNEPVIVEAMTVEPVIVETNNLNNSNDTFTKEAIISWLISNLTVFLEIAPSEIDISEPFAAYGLDSSVAVSMTSDLAEWIGCELEPTLFWEYPNIESLAEYLEAESQSANLRLQVTV